MYTNHVIKQSLTDTVFILYITHMLAGLDILSLWHIDKKNNFFKNKY